MREARRFYYVLPTAVSAFRVALAIVILGVAARWPALMTYVACVGVPIVFGLDAVDGMVARRLKVPTLLGSFVDIAADRVVEFIFLKHFISAGVLPWWFGGLFYGRILATDLCRVLAFGMKRVFATGIVLPEHLRSLVLSRTSRTAYAALKAVFFSVLLLGMNEGVTQLSLIEQILMFSVLGASAIRATPILVTYLPQLPQLTWTKLLGYVRADVDDVAPRSTKVFSCLQFATDVGLATWILLISLR